MIKLVLLRHGESTWNRENRFTGWTDVDLSDRGVAEAHGAAALLRQGGFTFDCAFTSVLKRAIRTLWIVLDDMDIMWIPVYRSWRLNERHYGALQGLNKKEMVEKHGDAQVHQWRRGYATPPPPLELADKRHPSHEQRYANLGSTAPSAESLKNTVERFLPLWHDSIAPAVRRGQHVLIAAHGNSLRALVKHLDSIGDEEIAALNIPTGIPLVYELETELRPVRHYYLGDPAAVQAAVNNVAKQTARN